MLEITTQAILEKLEESKEYREVRKQILDDEFKINDKDYDLACKVFNETSTEYFKLGFQSCFSLITDMMLNHE